MKEYLLPGNCNFYKANVHAHSSLSDGSYSPSELKELYKKHGYSILSVTDHFKLCDHSNLSDNEFLMITGCELAVAEPGDCLFKFKKCCHLNLYSREPHNEKLFDFSAEYTPEGINKIIADANSNGFLVCYNHPSWSMEDYNFYSQYSGLFAMEIYNTLSHVNGIDEFNIHEYDVMLRSGKKLYPIAADDCHSNFSDTHPFCDMFGGYIMVASADLSYKSIINALENGDFYASTGPEIYELYIEDNITRIKCSEVCEIKFVTGVRQSGRTAVPNNSSGYITEAEFPINRDNKYIRFEITDMNGKKANTRAYFL